MRRSAALVVVLVAVAVDILWVAGNPPPGDKINPFFLYLLFFGVGGTLVSLALTPAARRFAARVGPLATFVILGLVISTLEEVIAYATHSGLYQDGKHALAPGLAHAALPLFTLTLGVYVVMRLFAYGQFELLVVSGLSGWISESILGGLLFRLPSLAIAALPAIAFSYAVLVLLPIRAVEGSLPAGGRSCWRLPGGLLIPAVFWAAGGIAGVLLVHGQ